MLKSYDAYFYLINLGVDRSTSLECLDEGEGGRRERKGEGGRNERGGQRYHQRMFVYVVRGRGRERGRREEGEGRRHR